MPRRFARENFTSGRRRRPISSSMLKVPIVKGWKADSSVTCCDSNESGKNRDLQKQKERSSTKRKYSELRPFSFSVHEIKVRIDTRYAV